MVDFSFPIISTSTPHLILLCFLKQFSVLSHPDGRRGSCCISAGYAPCGRLPAATKNHALREEAALRLLNPHLELED